MRLIKPSFEILEQEVGLDGVYKQIEKVGRTCYKSENLIKEGSAKPFVDRMIASKHYAMVEHGTIYLSIPIKLGNQPIVEEYLLNPHSRVGKDIKNHLWCITTNLRVLIENDLMEDLYYICEPTEHHVKRVTVRFTCDRGVSHKRFVA
jgi:thymidylate synthase (FAD)